MEHCTVVYEAPNAAPLLRVTWNRFDQTYLATFAVDGSEVIIIDIRFPSNPVGVLGADPINSVAWAPHSSTHIATAGEDSTAHIWDLTDLPMSPRTVTWASVRITINNNSWYPHDEEWMAITAGKVGACFASKQQLKVILRTLWLLYGVILLLFCCCCCCFPSFLFVCILTQTFYFLPLR